MIPTNNGRDDIDTWPGEHYKRTRATYRYIGRLQPPTAQGGEYIYSPPAWRVCGNCDGRGWIISTNQGENFPKLECPICHGRGGKNEQPDEI